MRSIALSEYRTGLLESLNDQLEAYFIKGWVSEALLSDCCLEVERHHDPSDPVFWLLLVRLNEAALLTAGNYADAAEFEAAGDLLVNPRKTDVYIKGTPGPIRKHRHGRISDQFNTFGIPSPDFIGWFSRNAVVRHTQPPLLPYLMTKLETSDFISGSYLSSCRVRMNKIAETINFFMAWGISSFEELASRREGWDPQTLKFVEGHLCRFSPDGFFKLCDTIRPHANMRQLRQSFQDAVHNYPEFCAGPGGES